ncbi:MAG: MerR family transcriptional regulator [Christensenellales bacterium]
MKTYRTAEVACIIGVHPNTVRLYEKLGLIPKPERKPNGYRIFTDFHIEQFKLVRLALQVEVLQNGLRKKIIQTVKASAAGDFNTAISLTEDYLRQLQQERTNAEKAIEIVKRILSGGVPETSRCFKRKEVSEYLDISVDSLRNWEMNGLITVKRKQNGYRVYTDEDIRKLIIIRTLRCANYSLEAILQMLRQLSEDPDSDIETILNTPKQDAYIISVCDRLIVSLSAAEENACKILSMLQEMKARFL